MSEHLPHLDHSLFEGSALDKHKPRILLLYGSTRERSFSRLLVEEAARLLGAFESWRILEPIRQARAKSVLQDLAARTLSTDSYEIVSNDEIRMLGQDGKPVESQLNYSLKREPK